MVRGGRGRGEGGTGMGFGLYKIFIHFNAFVNKPNIDLLPLPPVRPTPLQSHLSGPHRCNSIARLLRKVRSSPDRSFVCYTPYNIGHDNIV